MESDRESTELVTVESGALIETRRGDGAVVPAIVAAAGDGAARRFLEFFAVTIDNPNTRAAYFHACQRFFAWCDRREDIEELVDIEPMHVAAYIRGLGKGFEKPTVKQHLVAIRMRVEDYFPKGKRWWVRLHEKGGKRHEMPAHHTLEAYIDSYIDAAGIRDGGRTPLFRSAVGRTGTLTEKPMNRVDAWRM